MSNASIMSIKDMIDTAFGEQDKNTVNFKLIQAILYILARQLRLLERRVEIEIGQFTAISPTSSLSVTEIKMHAAIPKKKRKNIKADSRNGKPGLVGLQKLDERGVSSEPSTSTSGSQKVSQSGPIKPNNKKAVMEKSSGEKITASTAKPTYHSEKSPSVKSADSVPPEKLKAGSEEGLYKTRRQGPIREDDESSDASGSKRKDYMNLDFNEELRERELRIIDQRADSHEEPDKDPKPMASISSVDVHHEKLLVVERVPAYESKTGSGIKRDPRRMPQLSVVTQEQFETLKVEVQQLEDRFGIVGPAGFPENVQLMEDLRRGASLTDAMSALQLSARVEASEKALERMMSLVTEIASKMPEGSKLKPDGKQKPSDITLGHEATRGNQSKDTSPTKSKKSLIPAHLQKSSEEAIPIFLPPELPEDTVDYEAVTTLSAVQTSLGKKPEWITAEELEQAMEELYEHIIKNLNSINNNTNANADTALKTTKKLEAKLDSALNLGTRLNNLDLLVSDYAARINAMDTGLSAQMTYYQEQLTQMAHDLEAGLEAMAESLANASGDPVAVAELNARVTYLQMDIENTAMAQKELRDMQSQYSVELEGLWKQLETLRGVKSDREEVTDALRDKADVAALNGLVRQEQFDAVRGDLEKRIGAAYDKFNNQEIVWQKAIDDLVRELNEKVNWIQLVALRDDINSHFNILRSKMQALAEIVGEPRAAAVSRQLLRDTNCLSCSAPAHLAVDVPGATPMPRPPVIGAEDIPHPKEDGDHGICYPGLPLPHLRDPRAKFCQRYCGGSHTISTANNRVPPGAVLKSYEREVTTGVGSDGRTYVVDNNQGLKPCKLCNPPKEDNQRNEVQESGDFIESPPQDQETQEWLMQPELMTNVSITPPPAYFGE